jgi:hypothetical protein
MVLGLAFASVLFAGRASVVAAKIDPGTHGSGYVTAGGWSGMVDLETGIPLSAGIPRGDEEFIDGQEVNVIPYLSHGILTAEEAADDPYLTDVYVRPGESLGGPDGGPVTKSSSLDSTSEVAPDGDQIAIEHELEALAQDGMAGYLNPEQNWMGTDRE